MTEKEQILFEALENLMDFIYFDKEKNPQIMKEAKPEIIKAANIIYDMWK